MGLTAEQLEQLEQPLDKRRVAKRQGSGRMELSYLEGYDVIDTANRIFRHDGWSYYVRDIADAGDGIITAIVVTTVHLNSLDVTRTDIGIGTGATSAQGKEKAYKEAVTDGLKRALRSWGNQFGNPLYDKHSALHSPPDRNDTPTATTGRAASTTPKIGGKKPISSALIPPPNGPDGAYVCAECGAAIANSPVWTAGERAFFSARKNGQIICATCEKAAE